MASCPSIDFESVAKITGKSSIKLTLSRADSDGLALKFTSNKSGRINRLT